MINTKSGLIACLLLIVAMTMNASSHSLWVESRDMAKVGDSQVAYSLFGHPSSSTGMYVPLMESYFLKTPDGKKLDLKMENGTWLPGFGWMNYSYCDIALDQPGDHILASIRAPGVYDPAWHGGESSPQLVCDYAKAIIHCGDKSSSDWDAGFPLEVVLDKAPYEMKAKDNLTGAIKFEGKPIKANYTAWYWTEDSNAQKGNSNENGEFDIALTKSGPWIIEASCTVDQPGNWTATYSSAHYNAGESVPYQKVWYRSTVTLWVR